MKKTPIIALLLIAFSLVLGVRASDAQQENMHPTFKTLLELRPRDGPIIAPSVARLTPDQAHNLVMQGKAILIETTTVNPRGHGIIGAQVVHWDDRLNPALIERLKKLDDKYIIILFCS